MPGLFIIFFVPPPLTSYLYPYAHTSKTLSHHGPHLHTKGVLEVSCPLNTHRKCHVKVHLSHLDKYEFDNNIVYFRLVLYVTPSYPHP